MIFFLPKVGRVFPAFRPVPQHERERCAFGAADAFSNKAKQLWLQFVLP